MNYEISSDMLNNGLKAILANCDDYIFFKDKNMTCQAASDTFCKMLWTFVCLL